MQEDIAMWALTVFSLLFAVYCLWQLISVVNERDELRIAIDKNDMTIIELEARLIIIGHKIDKAHSINQMLEKAVKERILEVTKLKEKEQTG